MGLADIAQMFIPLIFCGDEISDILYLYFNWDSFASQHIKNAALAFVLINAIINLFCALFVLASMKNLYNDAPKLIALFLCCGWIPVFGIVFILVYSKFIDLL